MNGLLRLVNCGLLPFFLIFLFSHKLQTNCKWEFGMEPSSWWYHACWTLLNHVDTETATFKILQGSTRCVQKQYRTLPRSRQQWNQACDNEWPEFYLFLLAPESHKFKLEQDRLGPAKLLLIVISCDIENHAVLGCQGGRIVRHRLHDPIVLSKPKFVRLSAGRLISPLSS